jgi:hypothetical protein
MRYMRGKRRYIQVFVKKPEGKRPLRRPRHRREDKIQIDPQELEWGLECFDLFQDWNRWRALV